MKRKGNILMGVLLLVVVITIVSVPLLYSISVNGDKQTDSYVKAKADEIAYGGYKVMETYILDNQQHFISSLDEDSTLEVVLDMPYTDSGTTTKSTTVTAKATLLGSKLDKVEVTSTTEFSGIEGSYAFTLYFESAGSSSSVFPSDSYYDDTRGNDNASVENMLDRLGRTEVGPLLSDEHVAYLKSNSNYIDVTNNTAPYGSFTFLSQSHINAFISALVAQQGDESFKNHIVFINKDQYNSYKLASNNLTFDLSGLNSPDGVPNLIFAIRDDFETWDKVQFDINGGNLYMLAEGMPNMANFTSLANTGETTDDVGQLTIATTGTQSGFTEFQNLNLFNTFYYVPNIDIHFRTHGYESGRENYGGLVAKRIQESNSGHLELNPVQWEGSDDILGYY